MNVVMTSLEARPVKNRSLLPQPRSAPVLGRSNVNIPANEGLYPLPNNPISRLPQTPDPRPFLAQNLNPAILPLLSKP